MAPAERLLCAKVSSALCRWSPRCANDRAVCEPRRESGYARAGCPTRAGLRAGRERGRKRGGGVAARVRLRAHTRLRRRRLLPDRVELGRARPAVPERAPDRPAAGGANRPPRSGGARRAARADTVGSRFRSLELLCDAAAAAGPADGRVRGGRLRGAAARPLAFVPRAARRRLDRDRRRLRLRAADAPLSRALRKPRLVRRLAPRAAGRLLELTRPAGRDGCAPCSRLRGALAPCRGPRRCGRLDRRLRRRPLLHVQPRSMDRARHRRGRHRRARPAAAPARHRAPRACALVGARRLARLGHAARSHGRIAREGGARRTPTSCPSCSGWPGRPRLRSSSSPCSSGD